MKRFLGNIVLRNTGLWAAIASLAVALIIWFGLTRASRKPAPSASNRSEQTVAVDADAAPQNLLDQMNANDAAAGADPAGPPATDEQLEKAFAVVDDSQRKLEATKERAMASAAAKDGRRFQEYVEKGKPLTSILNARLGAFEKDLAGARKVRPNDPAVQWLTAELLLIVGGEPENILPYLKRAVDSGLKRSRPLASKAKVEFDLNHFQTAFDDATKAIELDPGDQQAWQMYSRANVALERFEPLLLRLKSAFPKSAPPWVGPLEKAVEGMQANWLREQSLRRADDQRGDLPLIRLIVEHRKFATQNTGTGVISTGHGEVLIELFEDQAPVTVSNFVHLVETGFYNGTSFYWAEAGNMIVGGDPNTKNDDPADDGTGDPGYTIPDEFASPKARGHFRGTLSTVQNGPGKAGSQFFVTLVPSPEFDGNSTAFGRVRQGQEVFDQVTEGRTNREVGQFGKIIPGDLIVKAEVVRKRRHPYVVTMLVP